MVTRSTLVPLAMALALAGCNEDPNGDASGISDHVPAPLPPSAFAIPYPSPPYGVTSGSTIKDYAFQGFADAVVSKKTLITIRLSDFYNPHSGDASYHPANAAGDDRLYPPGSPYGAGKPKPKALLLDIASVWCGPCNQEAKMELPGRYATYAPCEGQFLFQLAEGLAPGSIPVEQDLINWTTQYKVNYPATFDAGRQLSSLYSGSGFPDGIIIDTRTMQIVAVVTGPPDDNFWKTYESLLDPACLSKH
jgi:hypothetical protein